MHTVKNDVRDIYGDNDNDDTVYTATDLYILLSDLVKIGFSAKSDSGTSIALGSIVGQKHICVNFAYKIVLYSVYK